MATKPRSDVDRAAYLQRALQMNPVRQAAELLALRRKFHGLESQTASAIAVHETSDVRRDRERVARQLDRLRDEFWALSVQEVQDALNKLNLEPFPDLAQIGVQLQRLLNVRPEWDRLKQQAGFDADFGAQVERLLVSSPRDVHHVREEILRGLQSKSKVKAAQRTVKAILRTAAGVYALEREWFQRVSAAKYRAGVDLSETAQVAGKLAPFGLVGFLILFQILKAVVKVFSNR
jgi:hypothetical protein